LITIGLLCENGATFGKSRCGRFFGFKPRALVRYRGAILPALLFMATGHGLVKPETRFKEWRRKGPSI
jgi:hypothetical protein